jgi:hypothetical protein
LAIVFWPAAAAAGCGEASNLGTLEKHADLVGPGETTTISLAASRDDYEAAAAVHCKAKPQKSSLLGSLLRRNNLRPSFEFSKTTILKTKTSLVGGKFYCSWKENWGAFKLTNS